MENFVFENLTNHKDLVSDSAELQFINNLYFSKIDKNAFL